MASMRTPVEELGLSCARLARRIDRALGSVPEDELDALMERLHERALARRLVYQRDDDIVPILVLPRPLPAMPEQLSYTRFVSGTVQNALKRLPDLYLADPEVRALLLLGDDEERWLESCWTAAHREVNPVFGRLDAVVDFTTPAWKDDLRFVEPNLSGIGGLHLMPSCDRLVADEVLPRLKERDPALHLVANVDLRELLMQELADHLEAIGRRGGNVCFVEPKYEGWGPDEQEELARHLRGRYGLRFLHADPGELSMRGDDVVYEGQVVDVAYRDYSILDLVAVEAEGVDVEPMRRLFRENRMVSSIAGDLDAKASFEVLTDPALSARHFRVQERQVFRRHIPWTRVVADRRTSLPDDSFGDLVDYARHERERLVLKPSRGYGGEGVKIGPEMTQSEWEAGLDHALRAPDAPDGDRWVVQSLVALPRIECPVPVDGRVRREPFFVVMGLVPSRYGLGTMARASQMRVVNVAQRGGMCALVIGAPLTGLEA